MNARDRRGAKRAAFQRGRKWRAKMAARAHMEPKDYHIAAYYLDHINPYKRHYGFTSELRTAFIEGWGPL